MALVNRHLLVEYDVPRPKLWHERIVAEHVTGENYIVITPDQDVYMEELSLLNTDIRAIRVKPDANTLPAGVRGNNVYPIPNWPAATLANLMDEARRTADQERRAGAVGGGAPVAPAPAAVQAVVAAGSPQEFGAGIVKWLAAEKSGGLEYGAEVPGVTLPLVRGAKAVHTLGSGAQIFVECVEGSDFRSFMQRPADHDLRILPLILNAIQQPERSLKEVAAASTEQAVAWRISGPRTAKWCLNYLAIENLGFEGHHERLRQLTKADASSWGIQEHFQVSMALRQAMLVDQYDPCNSLSMEIQFRRLQTIEYSYSEKAKDLESKAVGGRLSLEEQTTFGGVTRQYATLMICPDLLEHVKIETEKEATLAKNLRKAREERDAARKAGGKKGKDQEHP